MLDGLKVKHLLLLPLIGVLQIYALFWYVNKADSIRILREEFITKNFKNPQKWGKDYQAHPHFRVGTYGSENGIQSEDTTLVSQCSSDNLHHIEALVKRWKGPMSVAVFAPGRDSVTALYGIDVLRRCIPQIKRFVTFHILYPTNKKPLFHEAKSELSHDDCPTALSGLLSESANYARNPDIPYPQNSLRNLARVNIQTDLFYLVDIDTVPSADLRYLFTKFAKKRGLFENPDQLEAFVTPAFEIKSHLRHPEKKEEVIRAVEDGDMRPFHQETCPHCHKPTNYEHWYALQIRPELSLAFEIDYVSSYEPFYLAHRNSTPLHDERFRAYGYDRISQVCEMYVKGFKFYVLDNAFVMHKGFKWKKDFHKSRDLENQKNFKIFNSIFKTDMKRRYPESQRECIEENSPRKGRAVVNTDNLRKLEKTGKVGLSLTDHMKMAQMVPQAAKDEKSSDDASIEPSRAITSLTTTVTSSVATTDENVQAKPEKEEENQEVEKLYTARSKDRENVMSDAEVAE